MKLMYNKSLSREPVPCPKGITSANRPVVRILFYIAPSLCQDPIRSMIQYQNRSHLAFTKRRRGEDSQRHHPKFLEHSLKIV